MVDSVLVKCQFCNTTVLLRFQMGYFDIPFYICCPNCGVHISGLRKIVEENHLEVNNVSITRFDPDKSKVDYFCDFSVELPHRKICKYESIESVLQSGFSPFMMSTRLYGQTYFELIEKMQRFLSLKKEIWPMLSSSYSIYFNGKIDLLEKSLPAFPRKYNVKNQLDASIALHHQLVLCFSSLFPEKTLSEYGKYSDKVFHNIQFCDTVNLIQRLGGKDFFESNMKHILEIVNQWFRSFEVFIPAVMLLLGNVNDKFDKSNYGISTTSFDFFKQFYSSTYEIILEMIDIPVGLNNLLMRNCIDKFPPLCNCDGFDKYQKLSKAQKLKMLDDSEPFSKSIVLYRNIRNAIAHFNVDYDPSSQKIIFKDSFKKKENKIEIYLIDLACYCYENLMTIFYLNELMYTLRKIDFIQDGLRPTIK